MLRLRVYLSPTMSNRKTYVPRKTYRTTDEPTLDMSKTLGRYESGPHSSLTRTIKKQAVTPGAPPRASPTCGARMTPTTSCGSAAPRVDGSMPSRASGTRRIGETAALVKSTLSALADGKGVAVVAFDQTGADLLREAAKRAGVDDSKLTVKVREPRVVGRSFTHCAIDPAAFPPYLAPTARTD